MKHCFLLLALWCGWNASAQWTLINSTDSPSEEIVALSAPTDDICWFVTNFDNLYKTDDGGLNWTMIGPTATTFNPSGIFVVDANIAFKSSNQQLFRTSNGGTSWTSVLTGGQFSPPVVWMKDALNGVAASGGILYGTVDGGLSWSSALVAQPPHNVQNATGKGSVYNLGDQLWVTQQNGGIAYSPDFGQT